jgi:hypothetical protein
LVISVQIYQPRLVKTKSAASQGESDRKMLVL